MNIQTAEIVEILPTSIWIENDILGSRHVMMQHHEHEPFTYASFHYDYRYTSNSGTVAAAESLALALGAKAPVEHRYRQFL